MPGWRTASAAPRIPAWAGPSRHVAINVVWLHPALTAYDLIAWTQTILLDGDLAVCEPKTLRYRLLHVAARITRGQRQRWPHR